MVFGIKKLSLKTFSILFSILSFWGNISFAQNILIPLSHEFNIPVNHELTKTSTPVHTGFKPLLKPDINKAYNFDSITFFYNRDSSFISRRKFKWFWRKLRTEDFLIVDKPGFKLSVNPLLDMQTGIDRITDSTFMQNTRGIEIKGNIGDKISFHTSFHENQATYVNYIDEFVNQYLVVPGQGARKNFNENGHDFSMSSGYVSIIPFKKFDFQIQFGHYKHFIGEGYRSLLLSDNSYNYPFLKLSADWQKLRYTLLYTEFQSFKNEYYYYHHKKHGSFSYLSWIPFKKLEIGFFEGIIWQTSDSTYTKKIPVNFFNPIIFTRSIQYSLNNNNNILLGLNAKINATNYLQFYMQGVLDNLDLSSISQGKHYFENKYGFQAGFKYFDVFQSHFRKQRLYVQAEYNQVQPYMYAHEIAQQNYSHYNQALAHPLGSGFREAICFVSYKYGDFILEFKFTDATTSSDTTGYYNGSNIFISDRYAANGTKSFDNTIGQGIKTGITHKCITLSYLINPRTNLRISVGIDFRKYSNELITRETRYIFACFRTFIDNFYYDF